ncbi:hypothetical protein Rumeso_03434 [Rubellimicrobium mesophilum DSM 19309]|uniref:Uncharacterized protein n=1 Tax=Rubellimicrobium mesophilum DSM 19309 TaxID=442562 RepID=A0A017HL19_9RHOB|nr:toprim domain-containing protein [Rubellimicrobium mesophilum]EYD75010.1 hypothetical protein Rumeso_03434 [Rubellimicrobium mesophilum DSM 19309]
MSAAEITRALKGRWHGRYGTAFCPAHANSRTPALSLKDGTDGRLLAKCHAGCDFAHILDALRTLGLTEGAALGLHVDPEVNARRQAEARAEAERRGAQARRLWDEALAVTGTPAERYLAGAGHHCPVPPDAALSPGLLAPFGPAPAALVALVEGGESFSIHRTYLRVDGTEKADIEPAKAMLGAVAGAAVRLSDAAGEPGAPLVVAEGIETALSLASGLLSGPAVLWAALSTSGLRALRLPARLGRLIIAADGDRPGQEAALALAARADAQGWQVSLLPPPAGKDWNDVLRVMAQEGGRA